MLNVLIDYLINNPTSTTAPLFVALNTTAMKAAQGTPAVDKVRIADTTLPSENTPYIRLFDTGQTFQPISRFFGGTTTYEVLGLEIKTHGNTPGQAESRNDLIRIELEEVLENLRGNGVIAGGTLKRTSAGGKSYDQITNWQWLDPVKPVIQGSKTKYYANQGLRLGVMVDHQKKAV